MTAPAPPQPGPARAAARRAWAWLRAALHRVRGPSRKVWTRVLAGFAALVALAVIGLALLDWNALRGPIARFAGQALDRTVAIEGDLDVTLFSLTPRIAVEGLRIADPPWAGKGDTVRIAKLDMTVELLALLTGRLRVRTLELDDADLRFTRTEDGRATWNFGQKKPDAKPFDIPPIRRFVLRGGRLAITDARRDLRFSGGFTSGEQAGAAAGAFNLRGDGTLNAERFRLDLRGAPLLNVRRDRPYAFTADVLSGDTKIHADGRVLRPFDLARFDADLNASGPDLADLYRLTGVVLPNTPPYALSTRLERRGRQYALRAITGTVGDTDVAGVIEIDRRGPRMQLGADLRSKSLDFDDLATILGAPPSTARGESASATQRATARRLAQQDRLLPDASLDLTRVRKMDATLKYRAGAVRTGFLPLQRFTLDLTLKEGVLTMSPLSFGLPNGTLSGAVRIDARRDTPDIDLDMRLRDARLEDWIARSGQPNAATGVLEARAKLRARGLSVREAAGNANGQVSLVMPSGEIRAAFAELLGVNLTRGLGLLLSRDQETTEIRCAVADFQAVKGVLQARTILLDTEVVRTSGSGQVRLADETLALTLKGEPKKPRLVRLSAPIEVGGKLRSPKLGVDAGAMAGQAGAAAALGVLLTPLAALLPFVNPGLAEDADCAAIMAEAQPVH